jgi:hypothetical protein
VIGVEKKSCERQVAAVSAAEAKNASGKLDDPKTVKRTSIMGHRNGCDIA